MKIARAIKLAKPGIALLLDLVAATTFLLGLRNFSVAWKIVPLIAAGTLASFSSSLANNLFDRDIDGKMERTRWRTSFSNAAYYVVAIASLLLVSLYISLEFLNVATAVWIMAGFLSYSILYTVALKRRTSWNIVIGGIAGSFPALAGWSSVNTPFSPVSIFVAAIVFIWTPTHFWTLAIKYKEDYKKAGIPMLPSVKDERFTVNAVLINTSILVAFSFSPMFLKIQFPMLYYILLVPVSVYLLARVVLLEYARGNVRFLSMKAFLASNYYLTALLIVLMLTVVRV
ncbi:MAG: heme o synthase [Thermoplasmata archaeon]